MNRAQHFYVVDDDQAVRESLEFALKVEGYTLTVFADARAFLDFGALDDTAFLISDVRMPGMSGMELTRILRERGSTIRILLITGHGDEQSIADGKQAGADGFLEKPFDPENLVKEVERLSRADGHSSASN